MAENSSHLAGAETAQRKECRPAQHHKTILSEEMNAQFSPSVPVYSAGYDVPLDVMKLTPYERGSMTNFCSGSDPIDNFFKFEAADSIREVTYLFLDTKRNKPAACVSVSCSSVPIISADIYTETVPAVEITHLALDEDYQRLHMSEIDLSLGYFSDSILNYMISVINNFSADYCGATHIILYSTPQAVHFYERNGFTKITDSHFMIRHNYYLDGCTPMILEL